ncbi:hypothetical protein [Spongiactinospora gelatinilytica]|uniref:hypothetical protein n=1 Tax=Spongiactinospora gelatinilytica TaxID=2666298 RepID=UPI0018F465CC|nr:hypothetical protein [Spongiactinospora gelatinilytica]
MEVPLLLVDGHNLLYRATFGFPAPIHSRDKTRELTGVFGFFALLRVAIRDEIPDPPEVIVVFDGEYGSAERKQADASYKANRVTDETALKPIHALPDVKHGLDAYGIAWIDRRRRSRRHDRHPRAPGSRTRAADHVRRPGLLPASGP